MSTAWFVSPSGRQVIGTALAPGDLTSGTKLDGFYKGLIVLPMNSEIGTWRLDNLTIVDEQGNRRVIGRDQMLQIGISGRIPGDLSYSPKIWRMILRFLGRLSNSRKTICCHVPNMSWPSWKGTVRLGPMSDARMWEWPLPSPHF